MGSDYFLLPILHQAITRTDHDRGGCLFRQFCFNYSTMTIALWFYVLMEKNDWIIFCAPQIL